MLLTVKLLASKYMLNSSCNVEKLPFPLCFPEGCVWNGYVFAYFFSYPLLTYLSIKLLSFIFVTVKAKTNKCSTTIYERNLGDELEREKIY